MRLIAILFLTSVSALAVPDQPQLPKDLQGIGIDQRLNAQLPLNVQLIDEAGRGVRFGDYLGRRPAVLAFVYYRCTMLCSYVLEGIVRGLRPLSLTPGKDFDVIAVSIDPHEGPRDSSEAHQQYSRAYSSRRGQNGWHFLTGNEVNVRALANAAGFHYRYDPTTKAFLHASGIMAVTPEGRLARYFYGVEYAPKDLKLGLIEASANKIGSPVDRILLFCYHYDPATGKYGATVVNLLRGSAAAILLLLTVSLTVLWRRDIRADRNTEGVRRR